MSFKTMMEEVRRLNEIDAERIKRERAEKDERHRRFKAKDKTLVLTRGEYFWWKIFPILYKIVAILISVALALVYGVWYFVIIPLFVGFVLLELFFWYMNR